MCALCYCVEGSNIQSVFSHANTLHTIHFQSECCSGSFARVCISVDYSSSIAKVQLLQRDIRANNEVGSDWCLKKLLLLLLLLVVVVVVVICLWWFCAYGGGDGDVLMVVVVVMCLW